MEQRTEAIRIQFSREIYLQVAHNNAVHWAEEPLISPLFLSLFVNGLTFQPNPYSLLQMVRNLFQSELSTKRDLVPLFSIYSRGQLKYDGTRAETRFRLSAKRTSPFK